MNRNLLRAIPAALCVLHRGVALACKKKEVAAPPVVVEPTALPMPTAAPAVTVDRRFARQVARPGQEGRGRGRHVQAQGYDFRRRADRRKQPRVRDQRPVEVPGRAGRQGRFAHDRVSRTGATEFSIQKPSGWPKGDYTVESRRGRTARGHQGVQGSVANVSRVIPEDGDPEQQRGTPCCDRRHPRVESGIPSLRSG